MDAFFGAIGAMGFLVGLFLIILGFIKKKKYRGGIITLISFIVFVAALFVGSGDSEQAAKEIELDDYKVIERKVEKDTATVELKKDGTITELDYWISDFSENALSILEDEFKNKEIQKVRVFENSTFIDENGKESEDIIYDITINREVADQLEYKNFRDMVSTEPYRLFNKGETYYIHVGMFKNELSPELQSGFESSFEKK